MSSVNQGSPVGPGSPAGEPLPDLPGKLDVQVLSPVLVVGAGLMGTSVGLALRAHGVEVCLIDPNEAAAALAQDLGAGTAGLPADERPPQLVVLATPPAAIASSLFALHRRYLHATFTDLASVKSLPQREAEGLACDLTRFVGGHPLAGRERSGAGAARADLFEGRPWVLTPSAHSSALALLRAETLVQLCGAQLVVMTPERHDEAVALVSHVPQLVASLTAARLVGAADDLVELAGQGLRDVTRIAASDPGLWTEILTANAPFVHRILEQFSDDLTELLDDLASVEESMDREIDKPPLAPFVDLLERGNAGHRRIPGKHGAPAATYQQVRVVLADSPGELARLFLACGEAGINVEDVSIEHSPGQPVGLVELAVRPAVAPQLADALREAGWSVHG